MKKYHFFKTTVFSFFIAFLFLPNLNFAQDFDKDQLERIGEYLRENVLKGEWERVSIWTSPGALDRSFSVRPLIQKQRVSEFESPFEKYWVIMIDDMPEANFGHPSRLLFIDSEISRHSEIYKVEFPPVILNRRNERTVEFKCRGITPVECVVFKPWHPIRIKDILKPNNCKYAVLVSGGINNGANYSRYPQNLKSMYSKLRQAGFPKKNIYVYYADGSQPLDCDNADGDNNDNTGSDVTDGAHQNPVRNRISGLCSSLDAKRDVLVTYFSNHGANNTGVCLWDTGNNGLNNNELYSPAELSSDCADCKVKRHFMIHDQCYSGEFLPMASDGNHNNLVVYAAATAHEPSWGREYMAQWETNNILTETANDMHDDVVNNGGLTSTAAMAEGTANIGGSKYSTGCFASVFVPGFKEDCLTFPWDILKLRPNKGQVLLTSGRRSHFAFDSEYDAKKALGVIKKYEFNKACYVGRPNPSMVYLLNEDAAPRVGSRGEDCVPFNGKSVKVVRERKGYLLTDGRSRIQMFPNKKEANAALAVIKKYGFTKSCFVNRKNDGFRYWGK